MTTKTADPLLKTAKFSSTASSCRPGSHSNPTRQIQIVITSRENDKFYPIPRTVKLHCYPLFHMALCRPLRALTLNILLMEGKWSRSDCGQLGHWAEADDLHLFLSLPEAVQYLYFLNISGLKSTPRGPVWQHGGTGVYDVWYGCKWWWQIDAMLKSLTAWGLWEGRKFHRKPAWRSANSSVSYFWITYSLHGVLIVIGHINNASLNYTIW